MVQWRVRLMFGVSQAKHRRSAVSRLVLEKYTADSEASEVLDLRRVKPGLVSFLSPTPKPSNGRPV